MQATTCPSCGAPQFAARQKPSYFHQNVSGWTIIAVIPMLGAMLWFASTVGPSDEKPLYLAPSSFNAQLVGAPIAADARIDTDGGFTNSKLAAMVALVRLHGYRCDEITGAGLKGAWTVDFRLECNGQYFYTLHDKGGQWVVSVE